MTEKIPVQALPKELSTPLFTVIFILACFFPFSSAHGEKANRRLHAFVSIPPQTYFVSKVGGPDIVIDTLIGPGKNHDTFSPSPEQITALSSADVFFQIGMPFERSVAKKIRGAQNHLTMVDTSKGIPLRRMEVSHHHGHGHEDHGQHGAEGYDPHTWLDPMNVKQQAITIRDALIAIDPEGKALYTENCRQFMAELDLLHKDIAHMLEPVKGRVMLVFHPAYGYFTDAYGLSQWAVEVEGKAPKARALAQLIKAAKSDNQRVIFVQNEFDRHIAEKLAEAINGHTVILDPLNGDYEANLRSMARAVLTVLHRDQ